MKATLIFGIGILLVLATMTGTVMAKPELPAPAAGPRVIELDAEDIVLSVGSASEMREMMRGRGEAVILRIRGEVEIPNFNSPGFVMLGIRGEVEIPNMQNPEIIILGIRGEVEVPNGIIANGIMF